MPEHKRGKAVAEDAIAALVDDAGCLLGTGFAVDGGVLVTCAHVVGDRRERVVTARFGGGTSRREVTCRVASGGWFPRRKQRLCDEPDALCDVAILQPVDGGSLSAALTIANAVPARGAIEIAGYRDRDDLVGLELKPISATLMPTPIGPGWQIAKFDQALANGMSGSPARCGHTAAVVGMLAIGNDSGPDECFLIPAEALARAVAKVIGQVGDGRPKPALWLDEIEACYAAQRFAAAYIYAPRQFARAGEAVAVLFGASFGSDDTLRLQSVEISVSLSRGLEADRRWGFPTAESCGDPGIEILWRGPSPKKPGWVVRAAATGR